MPAIAIEDPTIVQPEPDAIADPGFVGMDARYVLGAEAEEHDGVYLAPGDNSAILDKADDRPVHDADNGR